MREEQSACGQRLSARQGVVHDCPYSPLTSSFSPDYMDVVGEQRFHTVVIASRNPPSSEVFLLETSSTIELAPMTINEKRSGGGSGTLTISYGRTLRTCYCNATKSQGAH